MFSSVLAMSSNGFKFTICPRSVLTDRHKTTLHLCPLNLSQFRRSTTTIIQASERVSRLGVVFVLLAAAVAPQEGIPRSGVHRRRRREGDPQEQLRSAQGEGGKKIGGNFKYVFDVI